MPKDKSTYIEATLVRNDDGTFRIQLPPGVPADTVFNLANSYIWATASRDAPLANGNVETEKRQLRESDFWPRKQNKK